MSKWVEIAILIKVGRGKSMLAQTVRKNITTKKNMDIRTKATKFSDLFQVRPKNEYELLDNKISAYVKQEEAESPVVVEQDIDIEAIPTVDEYEIVENPDEAVVTFPIVGVQLTEKLPFFKSITCKLASIYG